MSRLKQNTTTRNGTKVYGSYRVEVNLSVGKHKITLKGVKDKRAAKSLQNKANEIESLSRLYPNEKDWLKEIHITLGRFDLIPNHNTLIPRIKEGFNELITEKQNYGTITKQQTIDCYLSAMHLLIDVCGNIAINQISPLHKPKLEVEFKKRGWNPNTINMRTRNTMQFLKWCLEQKYISELPFVFKQIKLPKSTKKWIKPDEFNRTIKFLSKEYQAYAIVGYYTGLRLREINTNPTDLAYRGLYHTCTRVFEKDLNRYVWKLHVIGKQGVIADIPMPDDIKPYHDMMVANRRSPNNVSKAFKKASIKAGFSGHTFHDIRHSFCSNLALKQDNTLVLKNSMRHSSLHTTNNYLQDERLNWKSLIDNMDLDEVMA